MKSVTFTRVAIIEGRTFFKDATYEVVETPSAPNEISPWQAQLAVDRGAAEEGAKAKASKK